MKLRDKIAIVTGARRGIGRGLGRKGLALKCDVSSSHDVDDMVGKTVAEFGRVDILVNNAGIISYKPFLELSDEDWDKTLNVNLKGQFLCARAAAREMVKNKWGRIINIASISSGGCGIAYPLIAHYTASKGGIIALTEALAVELTPKGINVNAICPGAIDTDMAKGVKESGQLAQLLTRIPKGRLGQPEEIGSLAVFLASEESDYVSGAAIVIDGGWLTT